MKFFLSIIASFLFLNNYCFSQIETKPLEKKIEIDKKSNSILKLPENNLLTILKKISCLKIQLLMISKDLKIIFKWKIKKHSLTQAMHI